MENLLVPYIPSDGIVRAVREELPMRDIACLNWPAFPHRPAVHTCLAHDGTSLWVYYKAHDLSLRAEVTETNGPVFTDSCVEFFISPRGDEFYYNLEFNPSERSSADTARAGSAATWIRISFPS
jgi:hypothetical protein